MKNKLKILTVNIIIFFITVFILEVIIRKYDFAFKHFSQAKSQMQNHWKNAKYVVIFYENWYNAEYLERKLSDDGFIIIEAEKLTNEDLKSDKYTVKDYHPSEAARDLLTPLIVKKLNIQ